MMESLADVTGAILAGGLGTRLRPAVADRPKVLAVVRGRPYVTYLLDQMAQAGIREVCLLTGYRADQVRATLGTTYRGLTLHYSAEPVPLGTAGALRAALAHFSSTHLIVMNGDSYCGVNLHGLRDFHRRQRAQLSMVLTQRRETRSHGRVQVAPSGEITAFQEKGNVRGTGWVNAGIYLIDRGLISEIPRDQPVSLEREMFPAWIGRKRVYGCRTAVPFLDIGTPESYALACRTIGPPSRRSCQSRIDSDGRLEASLRGLEH